MRDGRPGSRVEVLERGDDADVEMKIVDGELWVRSRTGMLGYYGEEPVDPDGWRATGDLVEIVGDRIQFRGRTSEIINVGGVKVHPLPIEERVGGRARRRRGPGLRAAQPDDRRDRRRRGRRRAGLDHERPSTTPSARACADLPPAARPRSIRFVDELATLGSKIAQEGHQ